jgi:pyridoxamine 5'-phosphate oxidase
LHCHTADAFDNERREELIRLENSSSNFRQANQVRNTLARSQSLCADFAPANAMQQAYPYRVHDECMAMRNELVGDDPIVLFQRWLTEAQATELNDPNAVALATSSKDGVPNVRMVLIKHAGADGFSFFTNSLSQKGHELAENPHAALCFHWKSLRRQVRVMGAVTLLPEEAVDDYFHSRSRASQVGAAVSEQSHVLASRELLEDRVAAFTKTHAEGDIPRPPFWRGYQLRPTAIEFWADGADRLHDRRLFTREDTLWTSVLLYP